MAYKVWITTGENFATNSLVFAGRREAEHYAADLTGRWRSVLDTSVREVPGLSVTHKFENGGLVGVGAAVSTKDRTTHAPSRQTGSGNLRGVLTERERAEQVESGPR